MNALARAASEAPSTPSGTSIPQGWVPPWLYPITTQRTSVRISDAFLVACTIFRGIEIPGIPSAFPFSEICGILLIILASFRKPRRRLGKLSWFPLAFFALLGYLVIVSMLNDVAMADTAKRAIRLAIFAILCIQVAEERIDIWSGLHGVLAGLAINAGLFYAGLATDYNQGLLTGYLSEKNRAGLMLGVNGFLALYVLKKPQHLIIGTAVISGMVWLSGSRTTMVAIAFGVFWILIRPRLTTAIRPFIILAGMPAIVWIQNKFEHAGDFASRSGSDALRERIDAAANLKLTTTPWYGGGLSTATAVVEGDTSGKEWFFHNSYNALMQEGGWVLLILAVAFYVWICLRPGRPEILSREEIFVEGAMIAVLVCAWRLGEVFLSTSMYMLLGLAMQQYLRREDPDSWIPEKEEVVMTRLERDLQRFPR